MFHKRCNCFICSIRYYYYFRTYSDKMKQQSNVVELCVKYMEENKMYEY